MNMFTMLASRLYLSCIITWPIGYLINFSFFLSLTFLPNLVRVILHLITLNDTHIQQEFSGPRTGPSQRPLPDNTQHLQQTDIHAAGGIRTRNPSIWAAPDLLLRRAATWIRHSFLQGSISKYEQWRDTKVEKLIPSTWVLVRYLYSLWKKDVNIYEEVL